MSRVFANPFDPQNVIVHGSSVTCFLSDGTELTGQYKNRATALTMQKKLIRRFSSSTDLDRSIRDWYNHLLTRTRGVERR